MIRLIALMLFSSCCFSAAPSGGDESPDPKSPTEEAETRHDVSEAPGHHNHWQHELEMLDIGEHHVSRHSLAAYRIDADPLPAPSC